VADLEALLKLLEWRMGLAGPDADPPDSRDIRDWLWLAACSSVTSGTLGKAARRPAEIRASAASSASVTGLASLFAFTWKSGEA
jgi:hypothetical protein